MGHRDKKGGTGLYWSSAQAMGTVRYYGADDLRGGEYGPLLQQIAEELQGVMLVVDDADGRLIDVNVWRRPGHLKYVENLDGALAPTLDYHVSPLALAGYWGAGEQEQFPFVSYLMAEAIRSDPRGVRTSITFAPPQGPSRGRRGVSETEGLGSSLCVVSGGVPRGLVVGGQLSPRVPDIVFMLGTLAMVSFVDWPNLVAVNSAIRRLGKLRVLVLRDLPGVTNLPPEIGQLVGIQSLDVSDNKLTALPDSMRRLGKLKQLFLHGNPALDIPPEILGPDPGELVDGKATPKDAADILAYYFRGREETTRPLNEAKILLVGQGAVGKTSLVNRLVDDTFNPQEEKTEGINISRWEIPGKAGPIADNIRLNIWDFGGQEIMHATHQFFLTKRSLYLLVLDARKGENESNIHYWLRVIQSYGGDSPVLIVINKHEPPNHLDLNETRLRKDFAPNVVGFFKTSCPDGEGIAELKAAIQEQIHKLPHVYNRVPVSYIQVKEELEQEARNKDFIDLTDYLAICNRRNVEREADQKVLLRFLHDLGNVLNFDDPDSPYQLQETKVLNPEWVTGGVYKILNNHMLMQHGGVLEKLELAGVLADPGTYPPERQQFIVDMMRQFELCFAFPDSGGTKFLIPELLLPNEPDLNWDEGDALNFEYHYKVLPDGVIPRFIVRTHDRLTSNPTYWRSGVVLEIDGSRVLVRGETSVGKVFVSVRGPVLALRRNALAVIREEFRRIHATIPRIGAQEKVPLPDKPGVTVGYRTLLNHEERGLDTIMPDEAERPYAVQELLNGIEDKNKRIREFELGRRPDTPRPELPRSTDTQIKPGHIFLLLVVAVVSILGLFAGSVFVATSLGLDNVTTGVVSVVFPILALAFVALLVDRITGKNLTEIFKAVLRTSRSTGGSDSE